MKLFVLVLFSSSLYSIHVDNSTYNSIRKIEFNVHISTTCKNDSLANRYHGTTKNCLPTTNDQCSTCVLQAFSQQAHLVALDPLRYKQFVHFSGEPDLYLAILESGI